MGLANEAGYLYVYSKKLVKINKLLKKLSKKAKKHVSRHDKETKVERKHKHQKKHKATVTDIKGIMKTHNKIIEKLRNHQVAYAHALKKEHKTR
jgi:hypothetical protein